MRYSKKRTCGWAKGEVPVNHEKGSAPKKKRSIAVPAEKQGVSSEGRRTGFDAILLEKERRTQSKGGKCWRAGANGC